jgi:acyl carrier protein
MSTINESDVKAFLINHFSKRITGNGLTLDKVGDDFDLLKEGVIDSLGLIEMISQVESHFGVSVDFEALPTDDLTVIGPFSRYVAAQAKNGAPSS